MQISYFAEVYNHDGRQYDILHKSEKGHKLTLFHKIDHDSPLWTTLDWFILYPGLRQANEKMKNDN